MMNGHLRLKKTGNLLARYSPRRFQSPHGYTNAPVRASGALLGFMFGAISALRAADPGLQVSFAGKTTAFAAADLSALPHQEVTAFDFHEKQSHVYSGVPVHDLLEKAAVPLGEKLRGKSLRLVVIAHCSDHYDIVFALAEFDDAFNSRTILLVDSADGKPLPGGQGPLRLVVPGDKRPARWARMVSSLEVISVAGATQ
jgi:hypothetical protein